MLVVSEAMDKRARAVVDDDVTFTFGLPLFSRRFNLGVRAPGDTRELDGSSEDRVQHWSREASGKGVLLADVVAADERPSTDPQLSAMAESRHRPRQCLAERGKCPKR